MYGHVINTAVQSEGTAMERIGGFCRDARKAKDLSQAELADMIGYEQVGISLFERGKKDVELGTMLRLMDAVGLKMKLGSVTVNVPSDVYGVIGSHMIRRKWSNKDLSEACGIPETTLYSWSAKVIRGVRAVRVLDVLQALGIEVSLE